MKIDLLSGKSFWGICAGALLCIGAVDANAAPLKGDWPMLNFDAHGQRYNPYETVLSRKTVSSLQLAWKVDIYDTLSSPAVVGGVLYAGSSRGAFNAYDAATGEPLWSVSTGGSATSSPAVANGIVYVATSKGDFLALDAATGATRWSAKLDSSASGSPAVSNNNVYIGADSGTLYAFNAATGAKLWNTDRWAAGLPNAPAILNNIVYSLSFTGDMQAYDAKTGANLWTSHLDSTPTNYGSPVAANGRVYGNSDHRIGVFDAWTGAMIWWNGVGPNQDGSIAVAHGHIYAGTEDRVIWNYDKTGALKASDAQDYLCAAPTIANGVMYSGAYDGHINAYDAQSAKLLWSGAVVGRVTAPPVVANGMLYAVANGSVYAFGLKD